MESDAIRRKVARLLEALGGTPDAIAAKLHGMGIQGCQWDSSNCVLAAYLQFHFPGMFCGVGLTEASVGNTFWIREKAPLPHVVFEFRSNFDHGKYPQLVCGNPWWEVNGKIAQGQEAVVWV